VKIQAFTVLAGAGCITGSQEAYPVDAVAQLAPMSPDVPPIEGPIELLGTGMPSDVAAPLARTVAAYHVQLPDDLAPWLALVSAASCTDREPLTAPDDPVAFQDLGLIRRVGEETHFFVRSVRMGDRTIDVDTETAIAYASPRARFPRIVIAQMPFDPRVIACGVLTWQ
jgi:hypothetical protein